MMLLAGCPEICIDPEYSFQVTMEIVPKQESIKLGDTLYATSSFPSTLFDRMSGTEVDYANAEEIGSTIGVTDFDYIGDINYNSIEDFHYLSIVGRVYNSKDVLCMKIYMEIYLVATMPNAHTASE
ncbi:MAG: hypothetical protein HC880_20925 [Bacteroidia bacterium]|nr:hypothetical protein [Bacteroidia bacterium]